MLLRTKSCLLIFGAFCIGAVLVLTTVGSYAQHAEVIQAQAFGTTTMSGRSVGVSIYIEGYSTPEDQKTLIEAFNRGGHDALVKALSKMKSKGRIRLSSGGVGYQIAYIRSIPTENGRLVRMLTDRPMNFGEVYYDTRSTDYDLSAIEIQLADSKGKHTGSLIPMGRFKVNKRDEIEIETFQASPWRLAGIRVR